MLGEGIEFWTSARYNQCMFCITLLAFGITIWQLVKTRNAADAAEGSASATQKSVARIASLADLPKVANIAQELKENLARKDYRGATIRASDLRRGINQMKGEHVSNKILGKGTLDVMVIELANMEDDLLDRRIKKTDVDLAKFARYAGEVQSQLDTAVSELAEQAKGNKQS